MGKKRWSKQKSGQQKPKVRRKRQGDGMSTAASTGALGSLRGGFRSMVHGKKGGTAAKAKSPMMRLLDVALWIAVIVAGYVFVSGQCAG